MELKKFKDFKSEKFKKMKEDQKFINQFLIGNAYVKDVLEQHKGWFCKDRKKEKCVGFIDQDIEDYGIGLIVQKNDKKKKLIPIFMEVDNARTSYNYVPYLFPSNEKEMAQQMIKFFKETPFVILMDVEWQLMVRFKNRKDAVDFIKQNHEYSKLRESALLNFQIRDMIRSGNTDLLRDKLILRIND